MPQKKFSSTTCALLRGLIAWAVWACFPPPAPAMATMDQAEAARLGETASPGARALERALEAARARAATAGSWPNPSVVSQLQLSPISSNNMLTVGLRQPLDFRGLTAQRQAFAAEDVESLRLQLLRVRRQARYETVRAYHELWLAQAILAEHDRLLAYLDGERTRAQARVRAGALAAHDVVHVELEQAQAHLDRQDAHHEVNRAQTRLNLLLGRPFDAPVALPPVDETLAPLPPLASWLAEARASRIELAEAEVASRREARAARLAESLRFGEGELDLEGGTGAVTDPLAYGSFAMPVPLWNDHGQEVASARAEAARHEASRALALQEISLEVADAFRETQRAADRYRGAVEVVGALADHDVERAAARVKAGLGARVELTEARHLQFEATATRLKALLAYRLAFARLAYVAGR